VSQQQPPASGLRRRSQERYGGNHAEIAEQEQVHRAQSIGPGGNSGSRAQG
jgi:hypothetical protein